LKPSLFWDFRQRRLEVCYRSSGTTYPLKISLKTLDDDDDDDDDDDNDDNDDTTKLCPRKKDDRQHFNVSKVFSQILLRDL